MLIRRCPCASDDDESSAAPSSHKPSADVAAANRRVQLQELVDITASFRVQGASVSGVKVETLQVRKKYKPTHARLPHSFGHRGRSHVV